MKSLEPLCCITPYSLESIGPDLRSLASTPFSAIVSAAYPTADLALYVPFSLLERITVVKLFCHNGAAVAGNVDIRLYDINGVALTPSVQVAQAVINVLQEFDIVDVPIGPGLFYMGIVLSNVGGALFRGLTLALGGALMGMAQEQLAAGAALPNVATFASITGTYVPHFGLEVGPRMVI